MTKKSFLRLPNEKGARIFPSFHIEADGRGKSICLFISGVMGIKGFSESEVFVSTKRESITVTGELLEISVLEAKRVGITGKISGISFSERKRGGRQK